MTTISAVLIVLNEERNIEACLKSLAWTDEIILMDSGSTDRTLELARKLSAKIHFLPFANYSAQKNAAIEKASSDWILMVDLDERIPPELAEEIEGVVRNSEKDAVYAICRNNYFFGKPLRFSGAREDWPIRLFPRGKAHYEQPVHEYIVTELPVKKLTLPMIHYSTLDFEHYQLKLKRYIPFEIEILKQRGCSFPFLKMIVLPAAKFVQLYLFQGGFLDGLAGLQYSVLSSYYAFLKHREFLRLKERPRRDSNTRPTD
ncbi:MAG: glycosyltransferase family 2 protein [Candidatus Omnitrophica bacterium]|nr:glycosyltransferase family 2 protein [Candidatus Omnitrophota bacterium]